MKEKVIVGDLKPGMYVFEPDRPWLDTPYSMQGFRIESQEDVDEGKKYCEFVYIDPLKTHYVGSTSKIRLAPHARGVSSAVVEGATHQFARIQPGAVNYVDKQPVEKELSRAASVYQRARHHPAHPRGRAENRETRRQDRDRTRRKSHRRYCFEPGRAAAPRPVQQQGRDKP